MLKNKKRKQHEVMIRSKVNQFSLVGKETENTIQQVIDIAESLEEQRLKQENGKEASVNEFPLFNMIITGAPGTGKTTWARIISEFLSSMGVLPSGQVVMYNAASFHSPFIGGLEDKVERAVEQAIGGVLIIDDIQQLNRTYSSGNLAQDFMNAIVSQIDNNRDNLCVILCGYDDEANNIVKMNAESLRRFPIRIKLGSYRIETLMCIFEDYLTKDGKKLADGVREKAIHVIESNMKDREFYFGNAGYIKDELIPKIDLQYIARGAHDGIYTLEDIKNAFPEVLK